MGRSGGLVVAFVGSTGLVNLAVSLDIWKKMVDMPIGSTVVLRKGKSTQPGEFESVAFELANRASHPVRWFTPEGSGRSAVYERDYALVEASDRIEAYFAPSRIMDGGTGHVVEAAIAKNRAVYAWTIDEKGSIVRVGEIEPNH